MNQPKASSLKILAAQIGVLEEFKAIVGWNLFSFVVLARFLLKHCQKRRLETKRQATTSIVNLFNSANSCLSSLRLCSRNEIGFVEKDRAEWKISSRASNIRLLS